MRCTFGMLLAVGLAWAAHGAEPAKVTTPEEAKAAAIAAVRASYDERLAKADARVAAAEKAAKTKGYTKGVMQFIAEVKAERAAVRPYLETLLAEKCIRIEPRGPEFGPAMKPDAYRLTDGGLFAIWQAGPVAIPYPSGTTGPNGEKVYRAEMKGSTYFLPGVTKADLDTPRYKHPDGIALRGCFFLDQEREIEGKATKILVPLDVTVADVIGEKK